MKGLKDILLLGDPRLYQVCDPVLPSEQALVTEMVANLHNAMMEFRAKYKMGRAIAAPQLGYLKRLIYLNINDQATVFINPELSYRSPEMFELWDDCMSFPNLLVRLERHRAISIKFLDAQWQPQEWHLSDDLSELLQHEYDHLNGILCPMRALNAQSFKWRPTPA